MAEQGLSQQVLGDLLGISGQCVSKGMRRGTFSRGTIAKLVAITGLSWDEFVLFNERRNARAAKHRWHSFQRGRRLGRAAA